MFKRIIRNTMRRPAYSIAVLLFAAVLTVVLCYLNRAGEAELRSFQETYASVPVTFRITDLDGSKPDDIAGWFVDLFIGQGMKPDLTPFVGQLYTRVSYTGTYTTIVEGDGGFIKMQNSVLVAGIGSFYVAEELTEDWGGEVHWYDGYDESVLSTDELVCLMPESMKDMEEIELTFMNVFEVGLETVTRKVVRNFKVVGYYVDKGNSRLYCPYLTMQQLYANLGASKDMEEVCAVLNDNNNLPQLREIAAQWFAEPNPAGNQTEWNRFGYKYYQYALDIDDYMLYNLETSMKNSMRLNQLAAAAVFVLSAGAGFLTGFLVIRARKREIALMRTMGTSQSVIFVQLALEQMLCIVLGIVLGGSFFLWRPLRRLCLFGGIYFIGLTAALLIFLRKNLLTSIKEDE